MTVRKLNPEERTLTRPLYEEVFPGDSQGFVEYYYKEKTEDNEIYVVEEDGQIRSMLHLNPYLIYINGRVVKANYIVAVGTQKAYRGRGYMTALIHQALQDMYADGEPFTFLMPAAEEIYLPHDFRTVYTQKRHLYDEASARSASAQGLTVRKALTADSGELADFANQLLAAQYQVFALRSTSYYERLIREYAADGGALMLYEIEGMPLDCRIYLPEEETHGKAGEDPVIMTRLVHVKKMLSLLQASDQLDICFQVTDPILAENNRCIRLTGEAGGNLTVQDARSEDGEGKLPVAVLNQFVFGAESADALAQDKETEVSSHMVEELQKIVPLSKIFLNEVV